MLEGVTVGSGKREGVGWGSCVLQAVRLKARASAHSREMPRRMGRFTPSCLDQAVSARIRLTTAAAWARVAPPLGISLPLSPWNRPAAVVRAAASRAQKAI